MLKYIKPKFFLKYIPVAVGVIIAGGLVSKVTEPLWEPTMTNWSTQAAQKRLNQTAMESDNGKGEIRVAPIKMDTDGNGQATGTSFNTRTRVFSSYNCSTSWGLASLISSPNCRFKDVDFNDPRGPKISDLQNALFHGPDGELAKKHAQEFLTSLSLTGNMTIADSVPGDSSNFNINLTLDQAVTLADGRQVTQFLLRVDKKRTFWGAPYLGGVTPTLNMSGGGANKPYTR
jgi:hypothetical protein